MRDPLERIAAMFRLLCSGVRFSGIARPINEADPFKIIYPLSMTVDGVPLS